MHSSLLVHSQAPPCDDHACDAISQILREPSQLQKSEVLDTSNGCWTPAKTGMCNPCPLQYLVKVQFILWLNRKYFLDKTVCTEPAGFGLLFGFRQ